MVRSAPCESEKEKERARTVNPSRTSRRGAKHNPSKQWLGFNRRRRAPNLFFSGLIFRSRLGIADFIIWLHGRRAGCARSGHAVAPIKRLPPPAGESRVMHIMCDPLMHYTLDLCAAAAPRGRSALDDMQCTFSSFKPQPPQSELIAGVKSQTAQILLWAMFITEHWSVLIGLLTAN